jgi:hypothetical protein
VKKDDANFGDDVEIGLGWRRVVLELNGESWANRASLFGVDNKIQAGLGFCSR